MRRTKELWQSSWKTTEKRKMDIGEIIKEKERCVAMCELGVTTMTLRGFEIVRFIDKYEKRCSLQVSGKAYYLREEKSSACVCLGVEDPTSMIFASKAAEHGIQTDQETGWVPYPLPADVQMTARMLP